MWQVAVNDRTQHEQFSSVRSRFALAKADRDGPWLFSEGDPAARSVAIRLRPDGEMVRVECFGVSGHVELADGAAFWSGKPIELALPSLFRVGDAWFEIRSVETPLVTGLEPLHRMQRTPNGGVRRTTATAGPDAETVGRWLTAISHVHRTAASSPQFFDRAAQLTLESTGLDAAMVLIRNCDAWRIAGSALPHPQFGISYDPAALALVVDRPEVWRCPASRPGADLNQPCQSQQSVVVAPIFNDERDVVGAIYGIRHGQGDNRRRGIRPLEARVVELMADAVGVGIARRDQELESARQQVLLEQAFSPAVVEHLRKHPEGLAGQTREVTLLFADLRGFTSLAQSLSPAEAYQLLGEVMERLTPAVMDHGGVVIDYYGDGLSALWNAPLTMPEHADMACTAAMQMLDVLPELSNRWRARLNLPLELGIGVHAGDVQVGNAGARRRLKYGPRGSAVNIASRVQSATRQLDVPLLATDAVRRRLSTRFVTLRTCRARLPGLDDPIDLFTVFPATDGGRLQEDIERYAEALDAFESGDLDGAESLLADLLERGPATPATFLAQQAAALRQQALGRRATDRFRAQADAVIEILAK